MSDLREKEPLLKYVKNNPFHAAKLIAELEAMNKELEARVKELEEDKEQLLMLNESYCDDVRNDLPAKDEASAIKSDFDSWIQGKFTTVEVRELAKSSWKAALRTVKGGDENE